MFSKGCETKIDLSSQIPNEIYNTNIKMKINEDHRLKSPNQVKRNEDNCNTMLIKLYDEVENNGTLLKNVEKQYNIIN